MKQISFLLLSILLFSTNFLMSYTYDLSLVTMFYNEAPRLKEWITYHQMIGVEHFLLYDDGSDDDSLTVLQPYIESGVVEVVNWPQVHGYYDIPKPQQDWQELQRRAFKHGLEKLNGVAKWAVLLDMDEYLLSMEGTVKGCLEKHFAQAAGIYVNWYHFGTGGVTLRENGSRVLALQACSEQHHPTNCIGKSIVRPDRINIDALWNIHFYPVKEDNFYCNGDGEKLFFTPTNDLILDGHHHAQYLRINHYRMGDEKFFKEERLARTDRLKLSTALLWEHYHAFNKERDETILTFLKREHPQEFEVFQAMFG